MNDLTKYREVRPLMQTGDLLIYDTDGLISEAIKWWSPGANHAGMVLHLPEYEGEEHRRWTLEATGHGPRMAFLSKLLEVLHGKCYWHALRPEYDQFRNAIGCFALEQVGVVEYDFEGILKQIFGTVSADLKKMWCSEYVFMSWRKAKIVKGVIGPKPSELPGFGVTLPPVLIVESKPQTGLTPITVSP